MNEFMTSIQDTLSYSAVVMPALLRGAVVSVQLFLWTLIFALPLGLPIALGANHRFKVLKAICNIYIWIFRGTPLMLQLFFFYFFLPIYLGITIDAFQTAVVAFVLNYAAYFAEIYRGGMNSIDRGQYEAAHSLGLSRTQTMTGIILPQTMKCVLPPISNEAITLVKDTALVSAITVADLLKNTTSAVNRDSNLTAYFLAALLYLIITFLLTLVSRALERHFSKYDAKEDW